MTTTPPPPFDHSGAASGHGPAEDTFAGQQTPTSGPYGPAGGPSAQPGGQPRFGGPGTGSPASDGDKVVAVFCHLSGIIAFVLSGGLLPFVGPLIVWALYKDQDPFVRRSAAGSFNFHVIVAVVYLALGLLTLITAGLAMIITVPVALVVGVLYLWWTISASLKASRGEMYTYPMEWKILD